ncbi:MAG: methionine biosynthesis protein MetW [Actinobacteria bacterium HGW-Actinobacteria-6]|jgi:methionine biosynthesis protein MetW|nr:MAG: methionine biosynthesis protein MetW [Actinobacteria bacterium HGW-Actinobacteria-6]
MTAAQFLRSDLRFIGGLVPEGSRVLDLGCGSGELLAYLRDERGCRVRGVELTPEGIAASIARGLSVVQDDLDRGLAGFPDGSFDVVILSQTLQIVRNPALVLREMLRVGSSGILSFPNFGNWRVRGYLAFRGRMPVSRSIPHSWYDTPNIHHTTIKDFRDFVQANGGVVVREMPLAPDISGAGIHAVRFAANLRAELAVAIVTSDRSAPDQPPNHTIA